MTPGTLQPIGACCLTSEPRQTAGANWPPQCPRSHCHSPEAYGPRWRQRLLHVAFPEPRHALHFFQDLLRRTKAYSLLRLNAPRFGIFFPELRIEVRRVREHPGDVRGSDRARAHRKPTDFPTEAVHRARRRIRGQLKFGTDVATNRRSRRRQLPIHVQTNIFSIVRYGNHVPYAGAQRGRREQGRLRRDAHSGSPAQEFKVTGMGGPRVSFAGDQGIRT